MAGTARKTSVKRKKILSFSLFNLDLIFGIKRFKTFEKQTKLDPGVTRIDTLIAKNYVGFQCYFGVFFFQFSSFYQNDLH